MKWVETSWAYSRKEGIFRGGGNGIIPRMATDKDNTALIYVHLN